MKADINKRVIKLHNKISTSSIPRIVIIDYDRDTEKWQVKEMYNSKSNIHYKDKYLYYDDYHDYLKYADKYKTGTELDPVIILDDLDYPEAD